MSETRGTAPADPPRRARVLVVEDSPTQAAALAALLEDQGFDPVTTRTAEGAIELLQQSAGAAPGAGGDAPFALVLSDVVMPGMDGYELCRRIKAESWGAALPVVLLTSLGDPLALVRGLESGADHYLTKPYEPERLIARARQVIESPPRRDRPTGQPIELSLLGGHFTIAAGKEQIVELLVSSYEDLVRTSEAVRAAEQRARFLAEAGELLSSSLDAERVVQDVVRLAVPRIADVCLGDVIDEDGTSRRVDVAVADPSCREVAQALRGHVERWDAATADAGDGVALVLSDAVLSAVAEDEAHASLLRQLDARTAMRVPLVARGAVIGRLTLMSAGSERAFSAADLELATELARRAALALDNARLYRAAREATQSRDDMLAIVSHDLRNPIHTIQMSSSYMLEMMADPAAGSSLEKQVEIIRRSAGRANTLIQDLLDVSRIEAGRLSVTPAPVDGRAFLEEVMAELAPIARAKPVEIAYEWRGDTVSIAMDRGRIAQVLSNVVGNAIKFTPVGGAVTVAAGAVGDSVVFGVRDSGPGIPADSIPHLFDRFWQADRGSRHGAGLGLFIAHGIVDAHGGRIEVQSEPGEGAAFTVTLPIVATPSEPDERRVNVEERRHAGRDPR